jgi:pyrroloquinoline quinone biosynthesis protein D
VSFEADSIPRRSEGAAGQWFGEEFVVLDAAGRTLRGFNETAARVWELSDGTRTARQVAEQVALEFEAEAGQVLEDTLRFLTQLLGHGLMEEARAAAGAAHREVR